MSKIFLLLSCLISLNNLCATNSSQNLINNEANNPKTNKNYITEVVETGDRIIRLEGYYSEEQGYQYFKLLEITYHLKLNDNSEVVLIAIWTDRLYPIPGSYWSFVNWKPSSLMRDTFYLEPGDEIEFLKISERNPSKNGSELIHFTLYRDGILVDKYQGWLKTLSM